MDRFILTFDTVRFAVRLDGDRLTNLEIQETLVQLLLDYKNGESERRVAVEDKGKKRKSNKFCFVIITAS